MANKDALDELSESGLKLVKLRLEIEQLQLSIK
jgi:hypothetical protein